MQIVVPIDPTTVNILTDLFLVLLQTLWQRAMMTLTAADIRRSLRLGAPLPTYEHLGTDKYFTVSFSNYERHKASLDNVDKRWFRWSILKGLVALLITAGMVVLHLVIDLGLDFATQMKLTEKPETYSMVKLQSNSEYLEHLRNYTELLSGGLDAEEVQERCRTEQLTSRQCRQLAMDLDDYRTSMLFEGVTYSKMIYSEASLGSVDVLQELTFDYKGVSMSAGTNELLTDCYVEEESDIEGFRGAWRLSDPDCGLFQPRLKGVVFDMRARAAFQRSVSDTFEREYRSYENFKDDRMPTTKYSVKRLEVPDDEQLEPEEPVKRVRLTVDSGLVYLEGEGQRINITVLGSTDESKTFIPVLWNSAPEKVDTAGLASLADLGETGCAAKKSANRVFENAASEFGGERCSHDLSRAMGKCTVNLGNVEGTDGPEPWYYFTSFTSTHQIFIPTADVEGKESNLFSDTCGDLAFDEFFGGRGSDESGATRNYLYLGSLMESVCAVREAADGTSERMCATGPEYVRWDGREWSEVAAEDEDEWTVQLDSSQITLVAIEITGGDAKEITNAVENMAAILSGTDYANFKKFTAGSTSPRRIFGISPAHDTKSLLSAMVTQIGPTNRTVHIYESESVSVLKGEYVYTMFVMIGITCVAMFISLLREAQEARLSRNSLLAKRRIPLSRTDWVEFVLKLLNKGSEDEVAHCAIYSYEYTSRLDEADLEKKGVREEDETPPTGKLGFFKGPEPLQSEVDYK